MNIIFCFYLNILFLLELIVYCNILTMCLLKLAEGYCIVLKIMVKSAYSAILLNKGTIRFELDDDFGRENDNGSVL